MTPANIAGMAMIKGLDVIALTDHNSCKNCKAVIEAGNAYGILVLPGMELTTIEEVHVLCLFSELKDALAYDSYVYERLQKFPNHEDIFGKQTIRNAKDEVIGIEPNLLIQSTTISFMEVYDLMEEFHGVMIPAHIHKSTHSLLANLGFVPEGSKFTTVESKDESTRQGIIESHPYLKKCQFVYNSDAHYLYDIKEAKCTIAAEEKTEKSIIDSLKNRE